MSMGSGAAEGLQQVLQRLFLEAQFKQSQREHMDRQGLAQQELGLRGRGLDIQEQGNQATERLRQTQQQSLDEDRKARDEDRNALNEDRAAQRFEGKLRLMKKGSRLNPGETVEFAQRGYSGMMTPIKDEPAFAFSGTQDDENKDAAIAAREAAIAEQERHNREVEDLRRRGDGGNSNAGAVVQTMIGPDGKPVLVSVNPRTGQATPIQTPPGFAPNRPARPVTGMERNAASFFNRMLNAEREARAVEDKLTPAELAMMEYGPNFTGNILLSQNAQKYRNAQRTYTEARLRKESGAAVLPDEYEKDRTTNFRTSNEKALDQKRRQRTETLRGLGNASAQALQELFGEGVTVDDLLKEFADTGTGVPQPKSGTGAKDPLGIR